MSRADDLLQLAKDLSNLNAPNPRQVDLSRAVSFAYYALFHLLISEAAANWREALRPALGRVFEHGKMRSAREAKVGELNSYFDGNPQHSRENSRRKPSLYRCSAAKNEKRRSPQLARNERRIQSLPFPPANRCHRFDHHEVVEGEPEPLAAPLGHFTVAP